MKTRKITSIILTMILSLSLFGCASGDKGESYGSYSTSASTSSSYYDTYSSPNVAATEQVDGGTSRYSYDAKLDLNVSTIDSTKGEYEGIDWNTEEYKHLEENGFEVTGAEFTRIPNDLKDVTPEERETIDKMVERLEDFDDVQTVYTNMKPEI